MLRQGMFPMGYVFHETYRIVRRLGMGGMGVVFEVEHLRLPRRLALKVMTAPVTASSEYNMRFRQEAEIAASINHSNLVSVFDWNVTPDERLPYLVMELLAGEDLAQVLKRCGALPQQVAISILAQAIAALEVVHSHGIVHRDLKPANLFLCKNSVIPHFTKLLDFGIAKSTQPNSALVTNNLVLMGTPAYMAPEQARGDLGPVGPRSDQFALALVFYEMISGRPAFYRSGEAGMATLFRVMSEEPQRLADPAMNAAVMRALRKHPDERFQSLSAMLSAIVAAASVPVDAIEIPERTEKVVLRTMDIPKEPRSLGDALAPTFPPAGESKAEHASSPLKPLGQNSQSSLRSAVGPLPVLANGSPNEGEGTTARPVVEGRLPTASSTSPDPGESIAGDHAPHPEPSARRVGSRLWPRALLATVLTPILFFVVFSDPTSGHDRAERVDAGVEPLHSLDQGSEPPDRRADLGIDMASGDPIEPTPLPPAPRPTRLSLRIPGVSGRTEAGKLLWQCMNDVFSREERRRLQKIPLELDWGADRHLYVACQYWKTGVSLHIENCLKPIHQDLSGLKTPIFVRAVEEPLP